jgi:hypothetical protein
VATCSLVLYEAGGAGLTATDGTYPTSSTLTVTVTAAVVSDFVLQTPASVISGVNFTVSLTARDTYGNATANVPSDITIATDHGTLPVIKIAKESFGGDGIFEQSLRIDGVLTSVPQSTLTFTSGSIVKTVTFAITGVDHMHHFALSCSSTQIAGTAQTLTIQAIGESGSVFTGYAGVKNLLIRGADGIGTYTPTCTDRNGNDVFFGSSTAISFTNGVAVCQMKLYKAGTNEISAASSIYASTGHNLAVTVTATSMHSFSGFVPTIATNGQPFLLTLRALDAYGNTTREVSSGAVLSANTGTVSPASVPASEFTASGTYTREATISGVDEDAEVSLSIGSGEETTPATLLVTGMDLLDHLSVTSATGQIAAGGALQVTVSLLRSDGSLYTGFSGDKAIVFSGADATSGHVSTFTDKDGQPIAFGQSGTLGFVSGVATSTLTIYKAGTLSLVATDSLHENNVPHGLTVQAGSLASFAFETAGEVKEEEPFALNLTARDGYGNVTTQVAEDVTLSLGQGLLTPATILAADFAADGIGTGSFTLTDIDRDGALTLTAASGSVSSQFQLAAKAKSGGAVFIPPEKIDVSRTKIVLLPTRRLGLLNAPTNAAYLAVSDRGDFQGASWQPIGESDKELNKFHLPEKVYAKFRTKSGSVSMVISCTLEITVTPGDKPAAEIPVVEKPVPIPEIPKETPAAPSAKLAEGDIVRTNESFDVYIIKYKGGRQFRRLILSPEVFASYRHLRWENLKYISQKEMDAYVISNLVQVAGDPTVYQLFPDGDDGVRLAYPANRPYDADSVYEINAVDRDSYRLLR